MKTTLITLSNSLYETSRKRLEESAKKTGFENIVSHNFDYIKSLPFYIKNKEILDNKKFLGYWLWKPYIILEQLIKMSEGDVLVYADAGIEIMENIDYLIDICRFTEPIMLFGNTSDINATWVKRDCFVLMGCDSEEFWLSPHCDASLSIYKKCDLSVSFLEDLLKYSCNKNILTDIPNICKLPNLPQYRDHRYDQSVLSLLAQKYKLPLYRMPSQFGNHFKMHPYRIPGEFNCVSQADQNQVSYYSTIPYYNSYYGQLLNHHRTRNVSIEKSNELGSDLKSKKGFTIAFQFLLKMIVNKLFHKSNIN